MGGGGEVTRNGEGLFVKWGVFFLLGLNTFFLFTFSQFPFLSVIKNNLGTDKAIELKFCIVILQCIMNVLSEIDFLKS